MKNIEVKTTEYIVTTLQDDLVLQGKNLDHEIAITLFSWNLKKIALGRNLSDEKLRSLFAEFQGTDSKESKIDVRILGGNKEQRSKEYLENLIAQLNLIDNNTNIIDIKSFDVCERLHPNSFELDCYHGGIREIGFSILST